MKISNLQRVSPNRKLSLLIFNIFKNCERFPAEGRTFLRTLGSQRATVISVNPDGKFFEVKTFEKRVL